MVDIAEMRRLADGMTLGALGCMFAAYELSCADWETIASSPPGEIANQIFYL